MSAIPPPDLTRLEMEIGRMKDVIWAFRFVCEEIKCENAKATAEKSVGSEQLARLSDAAGKVASVARDLLAAEDAFRMGINRADRDSQAAEE